MYQVKMYEQENYLDPVFKKKKNTFSQWLCLYKLPGALEVGGWGGLTLNSTSPCFVLVLKRKSKKKLGRGSFFLEGQFF